MSNNPAPHSNTKTLFSGRTSRREFFATAFVTAIFIVFCVIFEKYGSGGNGGIFDLVLHSNPIYAFFLMSAYYLFKLALYSAVIILALSFISRRIHDLGHSGLFSLLFFIPGLNIILLALLFLVKGQQMHNRYGVAPMNERSFIDLVLNK
jgi:uncharacterized membrane protein YhaH (DUF805 family)